MNFVEFLKSCYGADPGRPDHYGDWLGYTIESVDRQNSVIVTSLDIRDDHLSRLRLRPE